MNRREFLKSGVAAAAMAPATVPALLEQQRYMHRAVSLSWVTISGHELMELKPPGVSDPTEILQKAVERRVFADVNVVEVANYRPNQDVVEVGYQIRRLGSDADASAAEEDGRGRRPEIAEDPGRARIRPIAEGGDAAPVGAAVERRDMREGAAVAGDLPRLARPGAGERDPRSGAA